MKTESKETKKNRQTVQIVLMQIEFEFYKD